MAWKIGANRDLPLLTGVDWDGSVAADQIFSFAGFDTEDFDPTLARQGFLVYDDENQDLKLGYKLPFCYVRDGELVAVESGVVAASVYLDRTDIPDDVKERVADVIAHYKARFEEAEEMSESIPFRVQLPLVLKAPQGADSGDLWIKVEASGPERDAEDSRMSERALEKFVEYAERGIDGEPLPFLDGHYIDLLAGMLGEIHEPHLTEEKHFGFYVKLDERNPQALRLYDDLMKGKRHGASISGYVHEAEIESFERDGQQIEAMVYHDIELIEVSRTTWPSWRPSFCELVTSKVKSKDKEEVSVTKSRQAIAVKRAVSLCKPDGCCVPLTNSDGKVSVIPLYGATIGFVRHVIPEKIRTKSAKIMSGLLDSAPIDTDDVSWYARSSEEFFNDMTPDELVSMGAQVIDLYRERLLTVPPRDLLLAYSRARDQKMQLDAIAKKEGIVEGKDNDKEQVAGIEEVPDSDVAQSDVTATDEEHVETGDDVQKGRLSDKVDAELLSDRFAIACWTMQDMIYDMIWNTSVTVEERLDNINMILQEFVTLAGTILSEMAMNGMLPKSVDALRRLDVERIEMTNARISKQRASMINDAVRNLIERSVDLVALVENADIPEDEQPVDEQPDDDNDETQVSNSQTDTRYHMEKRMLELEQQRASQVDRLIDALVQPVNAAPKGNVAKSNGNNPPSPEQREQDIFDAWTQSLRRQ